MGDETFSNGNGAHQSSATLESVAQNWLSLQCAMIGGARQGLVALGAPDQGPFRPAAAWPEASAPSALLSKAAKAALKKRSGVATENKAAEGEGADVVAYPIIVEERLLGVVAIEVERQPNVQQRALLQMLQWGAAWFQVLVNEQKDTGQNQQLGIVLELLSSTVEHESFKSAAMALATELATRFGCERVSIGFSSGRHARIAALSHSAKFESKQNLLRQIGAAMDEAIDHESTLTYPARGHDVCRAHNLLAEAHGSQAICTVPLHQGEKIFGAIAFERSESKPFDEAEVQLCEQISSLAGPVLDLKRSDDRWLITRAGLSGAELASRLFGAGHLVFKVISLTVFLSVTALWVVSGPYRVVATAEVEGRLERVAVAPQDGYVATANVRPGDRVTTGQLLATLDDKDLQLERLKWSSQREQLRKEYREALANHDRAKVSILRARIEQAEAEVALLDEQLQRTEITAPFDGMIVSGDLSRSLGAPVERGQVLYKVAPLENYRVKLKVDERQVGTVREGQTGRLALAATPGKLLEFEVQRITPVSTTEGGQNYFQVEARLVSVPGELRPGLKGVGKIEAGQRRMLWIWTHKLVNWMRLSLWSWWP